jgi:hypothetical protein
MRSGRTPALVLSLVKETLSVVSECLLLITKSRRGVLQIDIYFRQPRDAIVVQGATTDQKLNSALLRQLSFGVAADAVVKYVRLSESTNSVLRCASYVYDRIRGPAHGQ